MKATEIGRVAVVGAGLMGHGIALELAAAGYEVRMHDVSAEILEAAMKNVRTGLARLTACGIMDRETAKAAPSRISVGTDLGEAASDADLVIEAASEDLAIKRQIFSDLGRLAPDRAILASNTSSLRPSLYAEVSSRPDRVIVIHYANPPHFVPLVEIVSGPETSAETRATACAFMEALGKKVIVAQREVPGFILNRLQVALLREALWLVESGVASPEDVDVALKFGTGRRWACAGIFEVFELAGWDVVGRIYEEVAPTLSGSREIPTPLARLLERGDMGAKSGRGFFESGQGWADSARSRIAYGLAGQERMWAEYAEYAEYPGAEVSGESGLDESGPDEPGPAGTEDKRDRETAL